MIIRYVIELLIDLFDTVLVRNSHKNIKIKIDHNYCHIIGT